MLNFCRRRFAEPEDLAQEAFIAAWRSGAVPENPRPWLCQIAKNRAIDGLRRARPVEALPETLPSRLPGPELALELKLRVQTAIEAVRALSGAERSALSAVVNGSSYEDAAGELGVTVPAFRAAVHRARSKVELALSA